MHFGNIFFIGNMFLVLKTLTVKFLIALPAAVLLTLIAKNFTPICLVTIYALSWRKFDYK